jgi:hypothetical protein
MLLLRRRAVGATGSDWIAHRFVDITIGPHHGVAKLLHKSATCENHPCTLPYLSAWVAPVRLKLSHWVPLGALVGYGATVRTARRRSWVAGRWRKTVLWTSDSERACMIKSLVSPSAEILTVDSWSFGWIQFWSHKIRTVRSGSGGLYSVPVWERGILIWTLVSRSNGRELTVPFRLLCFAHVPLPFSQMNPPSTLGGDHESWKNCELTPNLLRNIVPSPEPLRNSELIKKIGF